MLIDDSLDTLGGFHFDPAQRKWGVGSCFENEGKFLYRTVRQMQPDVIVEIGRLEGCSTSHLALGCKHNGKGKVYSIDINSGTGQGIPDDLRPYVELINQDVFAVDWAKDYGLPIDLLLEDGAHTWNFTENVLLKFIGLGELSPKQIAVHDVRHTDCQKTVWAECLKVLGEPNEIFFEPPADCGIGIWKR